MRPQRFFFSINFGNFDFALRADLKGLITALALIGRFFGSASFSNIYLYSTELYPTTVRYRFALFPQINYQLTIRPVARKGLRVNSP